MCLLIVLIQPDTNQSSKLKINTYRALRQHVIADILQGNTDTGAVVSFANLTFTKRVQPAVFFLVPLSPDGIFSPTVSPSDSLAVLTYSTGSVYAARGEGGWMQLQLQPPSFEATIPEAGPATAHSSAASPSSSLKRLSGCSLTLFPATR